jgi:ribosomal-protein-alanine N-acetyltransferase
MEHLAVPEAIDCRMRPPEILETRRLRLRLPLMADAQAIFEEYAQDPAVTKYLTWRPHKEIGETYDYLRRCLAGWDSASAFTWVLTRKEDGELLGMVEIRIGEYKADLGYVLARSHWGHGFMPEAVGALVDLAMSSDGIFRVWAVCDIDNAASARVLEKVGMQKEGLLRRWIIHPSVSDEPSDCFCYSKTR